MTLSAHLKKSLIKVMEEEIIYQQMSIFDDFLERYTINKKVRLIEFFAGIGSQAKSLKVLGIPFEHHKICEWAANSIIGYNAIHFGKYKNENNLDSDFLADQLFKMGVSLDYNKPATLQQLKRVDNNKLNFIYESIQNTHNLVDISRVKGKDLEIVDKDKFCYVLTYSFPCQDLSNAGLKKGLSKGSNTRSGLLWEVERILDECKDTNLPDVLLLENVPDLISKNFVKDFHKWQLKLQELGYSNYCEILNGKDYGIPQNRKRVFMVSILGNYNYTFPKKMRRKLTLGDMLENDADVDEKYYLSDKMIKGMQNTNFHQYQLENRLQERWGLIDTITTRTGEGTPHVLKVETTPNDKLSGGGNIKRFKNYITWENNKGELNTECNRASLEEDLCLTIACANTPKVAIKVKKDEKI